ncbi:MAG: hypothetical protein HQK77_19120 [Desulfobacterales bacterium]|nr:hypothetical protein [Desulfobacterales bacterium]
MDEQRMILDRFFKNIDELYTNIDCWLNPYELITTSKEIELIEEASGAYKAKELIIHDKNKETIATIMPIAAWVIGANGRIDLIGKYDKVIIVYLEKEGFFLSITNKHEEHEKNVPNQLYKGIEKNGWYWIEDSRRGKAHLLNKELFLELLSEVSDYEF